MKVISSTVVVLANLEAMWLFYVLRGNIASFGSAAETNLTRLAGFQIIASGIVALVCMLLAWKPGKDEFQKWAFVATGFAILGLCAALVGAYPFMLGKAIR